LALGLGSLVFGLWFLGLGFRAGSLNFELQEESIFHFPFKISHFVIAERYPSVNRK
jgi:hypothetical protein